MAFNRELSQFANYLSLDASANYIGITSAESTTNIGLGKAEPTSKLDVVGDGNFTGVITATQFYGNLDYSFVLNATAGVRTEFSVVDNGGDGSLSYDNTTGIISYVGPSSSEARAHFSATSSDFGSLVYDNQTGVFTYTGVTTSNIHDQFSATSADIGSLSYNSSTGEFSLSGVTTSAIRDQFSASSADIGTLSYNSSTGEISLSGVTTAAIRDQFSGGTGVTITNGEVAIGQAVGTNDGVTFASVDSTGIVTAAQFVTGASGEAIGISTDTISGPATITIDPAAVGDDTGLVVIKGDLQVDGTQTIINSTTVTVNDLNVMLADGAANDASADGGGITVQSGEGNKTFQFEATGDNFGSSENMNLASGKVYKINNTEVLSATALGSNVVSSSLTSVGTLGQLNVTGVTTSSGGFVGDLTGNVTGDLTGNADTATALDTARDFSVSGDVATASAVSFDGTGNVDLAVTLSNNFSANTSGIITASGGFVGDVTGNADTATALETSRDFSVSGDATASAVSFDGTANVGLALTLATVNSDVGSYGSSTAIPIVTVNEKGLVTAVSTASVGTALTVAGDSGSELIDLLSETLTIAGGTNLTSSAASDTVTINLDDNISLVSVNASGIITATSGFDGNLTGNVTGDVTGNLTGEVNATSFDTNESGVVVTGVATATSFVGDLTGNVTGDLTGNADTATALETARDFSISGDAEASAVSFDGTANVGLALTLANTAVTPGSYGSSSEIPTFTVDSKGRLTAAGSVSVSTGMTVAGDSGSETIDLLSETLTIAGGTNLTSSAASDTVTINLDDNISLVSVNASGIITATSGFDGNLTGDVTGNADTATALETARDFSISGDATASAVSFDGTANVGLALTLSDTAVTPGSYGSSTEIPTFTVDSKGRLTAAGTASVGTALTVAGDSGSEVIDLLSESLTIAGGTNLTSSAASDTVTIDLDDNISLTSVTASGIITAAQFVTGASGEAIGINTNTITGPATLILDPAAVGDDTGKVVIKGDLQVDGTQTIINSTTVTVEDKNIQIADGAANDAAADGAGITVNSGDGNKTFQFNDATDAFKANISLDVASGQVYKIDGTEVLSSNTLGSGVVNSSLTSVGTLGQLNVTGVTTSSGGFVGDLTGNADTATALDTGRDFSASGDATAPSVSFDGTGNVDLVLTLADTAVVAGSYGSSTEIPTFTVDSKGRLTAAGTASVGTALTVAGDSGSEIIDLLSESLTISGDTHVTTSASADTVTISVDATSENTNGAIVSRDGSGGFVAGIVTASSFVGDVTGNADTATALETARDFSISGDATASAISFDGTGNVGLALTFATVNSDVGSYGSSTAIPIVTVNEKGLVTAVSTASVGTALTVAGDSGSENIDLLSETLTIAGGTNLTSSAASDTITINLDDNISLVSVNASGIITATSGFDGDLTGNVTGDVTGDLAGNVYAASGISTFNNIAISGTLADANDAVGSSGQFLISVGTGVSWSDISNSLPQLRSTSTETATSGQTAFSFSYNINYLDVFLNGVKLADSDYTATDGSNITLSEAAFSGDKLEFISYSTVSTGVGGGGGAIAGIDTTGTSYFNQLDVSGDSTFGGNISIGGSIIPDTDNIYDLGSPSKMWRDVYIGPGSLYINGQKVIEENSSNIVVTADADQNLVLQTSGSGDLELDPTGTGVIQIKGTLQIQDGTNITNSAGNNISFSNNISVDAVTSRSTNTALTLSGNGTGNVTVSDDLVVNGTLDANGNIDASGYTVIASSVNSSGIVTATSFYTGAEGSSIRVTSNTISGPSTLTIDPAAVGDDTGKVVIKGDLQVDGTTTTINSTTLTVDDKNITLASGAADSSAADGSGITIDGASATLTYASTGDKWVFNKDVEASNFNSTSDRNLKDNIRVVDGASELVSKLEGVHFTWKSNGQETIGVIAQQIEEHLPQLVQTGDTHKTVNYNGLIGVLIEAVKEQGSQIAALKAEIEELKK
jgi:hypothetical protein